MERELWNVEALAKPQRFDSTEAKYDGPFCP
jgi:hypothetical protein